MNHYHHQYQHQPVRGARGAFCTMNQGRRKTLDVEGDGKRIRALGEMALPGITHPEAAARGMARTMPRAKSYRGTENDTTVNSTQTRPE